MVRIVATVARCVPIGVQHATTRPITQQPAQHPTQQTRSPPCGKGQSGTQQLVQQACNKRATRNPSGSASVLHAAMLDLAHYRWRITYPERESLESCFLPEATAAEVAEAFPGAAIEPLPEAP